MSDFRRDKLGKLIAEIDGREVPLLDYGMVEYQLNRYLGQDIYNIYGNLSYTAYAFLTSRNSHHGYFELTEADNVRDTNGQLVTGFFQTPQYYEMASAYQKSNAGYLKVQVGDKELSTNIIDGRLKGLKSATKKYFLVLNSEFSIEPQTGKSIKHLKELTEEEVQQLNLTDQKVNSNIEFIIDGKTYKTSGRINSWKNSTINPLKTRLSIMSIGDGSNLHGFLSDFLSLAIKVRLVFDRIYQYKCFFQIYSKKQILLALLNSNLKLELFFLDLPCIFYFR